MVGDQLKSSLRSSTLAVDDVQFNSKFESGNLDVVRKVVEDLLSSIKSIISTWHPIPTPKVIDSGSISRSQPQKIKR